VTTGILTSANVVTGLSMGIGKICRLYNISYQVGLTEQRLPSDSEVINDHGITIDSLYRLCIKSP